MDYGIYLCRLDLFGETNVSPDEEKRACFALAESLGSTVSPPFSIEEITSRVYRDRPALQVLRRLVKIGEFDGLIVYSPGRLSGDRFELTRLMEEFASYGIPVYFVVGSCDDVPEERLAA